MEFAGVSVGAVVGSCLAGFLIGLSLTALVCFYYLRLRNKPRMPGSPHYISRQNPYVTVPLKDVSSSKNDSNNRRYYQKSNNNSLLKRSDSGAKNKPIVFSFTQPGQQNHNHNNNSVKRQPSFNGSIHGTLRSCNGTLRSNGTLTKSKNNTLVHSLASPKLYPKSLETYETSTLKRNSREAQIRAEFEQEKFY